MEKRWPAVELSADDTGLVLAVVDEAGPTAVEETEDGLRIFFSSPSQRDDAVARLAAHGYRASPIDVSDENWAERSQADLKPVTVGRLTVFPGSFHSPDPSNPCTIPIAIPPSTAFGTGHHATTRLCLAALQQIPLEGRRVLDVGTGSGLLAIAAARLGAARVVGIDNDEDAIGTALANLALNGGDPRVVFALADLRDRGAHGDAAVPTDVVVANLTAALLVAAAPSLLAAVRPGGHLVVGGLLVGERDEVLAALGPATRIWQDEEDGWAALILNCPARM